MVEEGKNPGAGLFGSGVEAVETIFILFLHLVVIQRDG